MRYSHERHTLQHKHKIKHDKTKSLNSSPEPIRSVTSRYYQGIFLTLKCLILKLRNMKNFIELSADNGKILVNVQAISNVTKLENGKGSIVLISALSNGYMSIDTQETYEEIKTLIQDSF
nr:MAG TPA: hypothetical protein [Caudoviricetes sp.]DAZ30154.1 MAG TPA: hypothetical protein [Caudoviricetes sp.]